MRTVDPAKHRERRRQILGAAARLFAEKGFERTTTAEICRAAGMSPGNLFHYFPSKRAIFAAVLTDDDGGDRSGRLAAARTAADPLAALFDTVDLLAEAALDPLSPPLVMEAMVMAYRDPELAESLGADNDEEHAALTDLLTRAVAAGQVDPGLDPRNTATWIQTLIGALYTSAATDPAFVPAEQLPTLHLIVRRFLRAEAGAGTSGGG
ncbi:TetR/AcrR family transcriptional regulator [Streptomonospora sp. S1-112]|uniref:TetR/AcrR family transcriptional regulator n=1 Tax=Streptomonospora mangrovi TaxID=2883123 RepID=A0A9X3NIU0_9ACTN|nr:TetR/AcrR family transcriptional regulator [Streptomonospora mangrovi]MDA0563993.1 TetR/AcrR family transcriptional regulator [Streptomonospora mangrovi]